MRIIADGLSFAEGPVVLPGGDIAVCETHAAGIVRISLGGRKTNYADVEGGANGAALGSDGAMYICNNGAWYGKSGIQDGSARIGGRIQRVLEGGQPHTLYDHCDGRRLMAPNDIVFDEHGNFYFTDFGSHIRDIRDVGVSNGDKDIVGILNIVIHCPPGSLYYASPDGKMIREIVHPLLGANGVGLSPDGKTLYVAESTTARLWAFELIGPGEVGSRRCLGTLPLGTTLNIAVADSLVVDSAGNIIVGTILNGGLTVFSPDGTTVLHVPTGDMLTTNACFGGPDMRSLYVTLGERGALGVFDPWPVAGLKLNFQPDHS
ncbi:gluconolactonase (plasmid) [Sphingobium sp. TKS]|nr:gluconolactonase [Sphingobium sp. TKS]